MESARFQYHRTKIVYYAIRAAFVGIAVVPALFFLSISGGLGSEPPEHGEEVFGLILFVVIAPAYYAVALLHAVGIAIDLIDWMLGVILVPLFWGAVFYCVVQLCCVIFRSSRQRLTSRCS